jgi:hypothetical protein
MWLNNHFSFTSFSNFFSFALHYPFLMASTRPHALILSPVSGSLLPLLSLFHRCPAGRVLMLLFSHHCPPQGCAAPSPCPPAPSPTARRIRLAAGARCSEILRGEEQGGRGNSDSCRFRRRRLKGGGGGLRREGWGGAGAGARNL